jgi:DNA-directed RNA polymerase subunit RPC12/RpoP
VSISVSIPLDSDGFLRRECLSCGREFKWHDGPANEGAESAEPTLTYYCPLCGQPASTDDWWTSQQMQYLQHAAMPMAVQQVQEALEDALGGHRGITYQPGGGWDDLPMAPLLTEPDDMRILASPCHDYEPVKVPEAEAGPFHCLVCGAAFAT